MPKIIVNSLDEIGDQLLKKPTKSQRPLGIYVHQKFTVYDLFDPHSSSSSVSEEVTPPCLTKQSGTPAHVLTAKAQEPAESAPIKQASSASTVSTSAGNVLEKKQQTLDSSSTVSGPAEVFKTKEAVKEEVNGLALFVKIVKRTWHTAVDRTVHGVRDIFARRQKKDMPVEVFIDPGCKKYSESSFVYV